MAEGQGGCNTGRENLGGMALERAESPGGGIHPLFLL